METTAVVYARPYDELPLKTDKYAQSCATLHLGNKGITHLSGFEKFLNLNTLFLNNNCLTDIEGLEGNFRIKQLYLHNNRIRRLQPGCFAPFKFLNVLSLNGNCLDDLEGTIEEIKSLGHLKSVDLFDNPIAQEDNYRKRVICELSPSCEVLDRHNITPEERTEAHHFKVRMAKLAKLSSSSRGKAIKLPPTEEEEAEARRQKQKLDNILDNIRKFMKDNRPELEQSWLRYDKRELGIVTPDKFWEVLRQFGIEQLLTDDERQMIETHYTSKAVVPALSATGTLTHTRINYFKFCWDVVPSVLLVHRPTWEMEKAPEISVTARDLNRYVRTVERRTQELEESTRRAQLEASRALIAEGSKNVFGDKKVGMEHKCMKHGLDPWTSAELSRIIAVFESETNPTECTLTYSQAQTVFRKMMRFRLIPEMGVNKALETLFTATEGSAAPTGNHHHKNQHGGGHGHAAGHGGHGHKQADKHHHAAPHHAGGGGLSDDNTNPISAVQFRAIVGCSTTSPKCFANTAPSSGGGGGGGAAAAKGSTTKGKPAKAEPAAGTGSSGGGRRSSLKPEVPTPWVLKWRLLTDEEEGKLAHKVSDNAAALLDKLLRLNAKDDSTLLMKDTLAASIDLSRMNKNTILNSSGLPNDLSGSIPSKYRTTVAFSTIAARSDNFMLPNLSNPVLPVSVDDSRRKTQTKKFGKPSKHTNGHDH
jgi:hypothetical protein